MSNKLDNLFKKALQDRSDEPPAYVWDKIRHQLDRRRTARIWWWRGIAAVALIAAATGNWQLRNNQAPTKVSEIAIVISDTVQHHLTSVFSIPSLIVASNESKQETNLQTGRSDNPEVFCRESISPALALKTETLVAIMNSTLGISLNNNNIRQDFIPLTSSEAIRNNTEYQLLLSQKEVREEKLKEKIKIEFSGLFTPAYSSGKYSSDIKNTRGNNYSQNQMDGLMNVGGGLRVAVAKGKRLSFQTGIFYSRMGQKTTDTYGGARTLAYSLSNNDKRMATPLGNIKRRATTLPRTSEAMMLPSFNGEQTTETLEQIFGTVEIPLQVRYRLNNNKVLFSIIGGFSGNFIVNNKVFMEVNDDREYIGSTEDIRDFNMSTDWGVGIECPITSKIKIMIEPGFKYYLQSLSRNEDIIFKPYLFTLSTGIGINF